MSTDDNSDESINKNLKEETSDPNINTNSDQILNDFEKEGDLDANVGENLDFDYENQCENHLADHGRVPYTANDLLHETSAYGIRKICVFIVMKM